MLPTVALQDIANCLFPARKKNTLFKKCIVLCVVASKILLSLEYTVDVLVKTLILKRIISSIRFFF